MSRPLVLLPSSKRKATGGGDPAYREALDGWPALAPTRFSGAAPPGEG